MKQLILVSQDKTNQVIYNGAFINKTTTLNDENEFITIYEVCAKTSISYTEIGKYKTKEKAQEVLDEILNRYLNGRKVYYLPKDDEMEVEEQ